MNKYGRRAAALVEIQRQIPVETNTLEEAQVILEEAKILATLEVALQLRDLNRTVREGNNIQATALEWRRNKGVVPWMKRRQSSISLFFRKIKYKWGRKL